MVEVGCEDLHKRLSWHYIVATSSRQQQGDPQARTSGIDLKVNSKFNFTM